MIYLSDYEDKYNNIFSDWSFTKNDPHLSYDKYYIEEDNSAGTIEDEFIIKINDDASSGLNFYHLKTICQIHLNWT